jgi:ribosomal protein L29
MKTLYEKDIVAWSNEQARLIRAGRFELLDLEHIAEEIEDVGKSEQRELANRMVVLLAHLLKWQYQPERQGASWEKTIRAQRKDIAYVLEDTPSLVVKLNEARWLDVVWAKAVALAVSETGLDCFPEICPWLMEDEILDLGWLPASI